MCILASGCQRNSDDRGQPASRSGAAVVSSQRPPDLSGDLPLQTCHESTEDKIEICAIAPRWIVQSHDAARVWAACTGRNAVGVWQCSRVRYEVECVM